MLERDGVGGFDAIYFVGRAACCWKSWFGFVEPAKRALCSVIISEVAHNPWVVCRNPGMAYCEEF